MAFGAAGCALADNPMSESDEEWAKLERAAETVTQLRKPRAEFLRHGAWRLPKIKASPTEGGHCPPRRE